MTAQNIEIQFLNIVHNYSKRFEHKRHWREIKNTNPYRFELTFVSFWYTLCLLFQMGALAWIGKNWTLLKSKGLHISTSDFFLSDMSQEPKS